MDRLLEKFTFTSRQPRKPILEWRIPLFHVGTSESIEELKKEIFDSSISNNSGNKNWLGKGIYFWDNKGNAKYWYDQKKSDPVKIACVPLRLNDSVNYVDFTDCNQLISFDKLWAFYKRNSNNKKKGKKKDFVDYLSEKFNISVIRCTAVYPKIRIFKFIAERMKEQSMPHICGNVKVIYCIKKNFRNALDVSNLSIVDAE